MLIAEPVDVRQLLRDNETFDLNDVNLLRGAIAGPQVSEVRRVLQELQAEVDGSSKPSTAALVRAGVGSYLLGQHDRACGYLSRVMGDPIASFFHALTLTSLGQHAEAEKKFLEAGKLGYDRVECQLRAAGEMRAQGRVDEAEQKLREIASEAAGRAEYSYQMGCIWADRGDTDMAVEYFERAVDMDPNHARALFRLAVENSRAGNDEEAIRLYEQALSRPPLYVGAMLNLGLLYEDRENYSAAAYCFRRILEVNPQHERARLYLRDIDATRDMYYDEETAKTEARLEQLLSRPITDFELSVRSRNCLLQMDIHTLRDLTEVSEQDLLAGKNFGETSLHEIREMMAAHGLRIGQRLHAAKVPEYAPHPMLSAQEQQQLSRPISDLNLSVRARKCMTRLGISTVGELIQRTPDELLASRNFGVTSLNEIRSKLAELNLKLRND